ncbi:DNA repair protein REV1-like isoform X3 [Diospyros lotus]|uniref:DNA repair protein REV1-like isoform X3 n=1 Tax=Diospyros lotus TaxID=55363 RepID=UPI002256B565|nr:DNA repair protein REV1-like isoform X3 [Diospyros lotus]
MLHFLLSSFRSSLFSDSASDMAVNNQKLQEQFDAEALTSSNHCSKSGKPIFEGVCIFVGGFNVVPSSQGAVRVYNKAWGGRFENYYSRHRVTHIICSNLPDSTIRNTRFGN